MSDEIQRNEAGRFVPGRSANPETLFPKGKSANPGGIPKTRRELRALAREHMPRAIERAREVLDNDRAKPKDWNEAAKFLATVAGLSTPPKSDRDDDAAGVIRTPLTVEERRAIARMRLSSEAPPDVAPGNTANTEH